MATERRKYPRVAYPLEGVWRAGGATSACRISDLSLGGCFVYALAAPATGKDVEISVRIGDDMLTFNGRVVSLEHTVGFALEFQNLSIQQRTHIQQILEAVTTD